MGVFWLMIRNLDKQNAKIHTTGVVGTYDAKSGRYTTRRRSQAPTAKEYAVAETIFDMIDVDGSGTVDCAEMSKYLISMGEKPSQVQFFFTKLDSNNDGVITREEWRDGWKDGVFALQPPREAAASQAQAASKAKEANGMTMINPETGLQERVGSPSPR